MSIIVTSLKDLIDRMKKEGEDSKNKAVAQISEIRNAPNNIIQMPQVQKPSEAQRVQQPVIQPKKTIPPKTGGCGCWGNE